MRRIALVAAMALAAPVAWLGSPASAFSCAPVDVERKLASGSVLAVVTRTDTDGGERAFRVERREGGRLPASVAGHAELPYDGVAAVVVERVEGRWIAATCSKTDLGTTLDRFNGAPQATSTEPVAAVLAGRFGGSRLAAIDSRGEVVAWDRRPGEAVNLAVCPGGRTVVAHAYPDPNSADRELTVHDAATLDVRATLDSTAFGRGWVRGLRCTDPDGREVQAIVEDDSPHGTSRLVTVSQTDSTDRPLGYDAGDYPVDFDGFLDWTTDRSEPARSHLVHVSPDGNAREVAEFAGATSVHRLAIAPDQSLAAAVLTVPGPHEFDDVPGWGRMAPNTVVVFDPRSGAELARVHPDRHAESIAWTRDGRLLVRTGHVNSAYDYRAGTLEVRDAGLRLLETHPAGTGSGLASLEDRPVTFGQGRLVVAHGDRLRTVDNPWLAGAWSLAPLDAAPPEAVAPISTAGATPAVFAGLAVVVGGLGFARARERRR
ncbi:MAG: hypothetical protein ACT4QF_03700 [Sporichthyaceae bacterium]